jgi:hypothetical protein
LLSGGSSNSNPTLSLGGQPSSTEIGSGLNSLFRDISDSEANSGITDYRCFYVVNKSQGGTLYRASLHVESSDYGDSSVLIGTARSTESQIISVSGPVFLGSVTFSLGGEEFSALWGSSADDFADNLSSGLASIGVGGVDATYSYSGSIYRFVLVFGGANDNRSLPLLLATENLLGGVEEPSLSISRQTAGKPVNSVAPLIATPQTPPAGVSFIETSSSSKMLVGTLGPGDRIPVWLRRNTPSYSVSKQDANLVVRVSGDTSPS